MKQIFLFLAVFAAIQTGMAQPTAGLVAYWPMNGNYTDAGPNGINGTNAGSTATTDRYSLANTAMSFLNPGSTVPQYATHPVNSNVNFSGNQDFTISFWMLTNSPFVHYGGFYDNNLNYGGPGIWFWNANGFPQIQFNYKGGSVGTFNGAFLLGIWRNICCIRQSGTLKIYINGVLIVSGAEGGITPVYNFPARFGTMFYNSFSPPQYNGFNGKLDEFRIYNRALSSSEIIFLTVLPIRLSSFTATVNNDNNVQLRWTTAQEQNTGQFNVERSTDGISFNKIGAVKAMGNTSSPTDYSFTDITAKNMAGAETVFYRLESVDIDAHKQYSPVVAVKLKEKDAGLLVENPVRNELKLQFRATTRETAQLIITDAAGHTVFSQPVQQEPGIFSTAIPVSRLPAGQYFVTIQNRQGKQSCAFIKL